MSQSRLSRYESAEKITDVWCLPTANGKNGHGAEFPLALPGRCIALSSDPGDLVIDPFLGSGTTALAALDLGRRCVGFDISEQYVALSRARVAAACAGPGARTLWDVDVRPGAASTNGNGAYDAQLPTRAHARS
ncbi:MAG: site-specific DNA-methyltransferase [Gemmatimonadaceae bacterium]|nr:site-specific DNA-methyltransferase [Gemmatimonadaceae bacterium]